MRGSDFVFGYVDRLRYLVHKISLPCDGSYIPLIRQKIKRATKKSYQ